MAVPLDLEGTTYSPDGRTQFVQELRERLGGLPGVRSVAAAWAPPFVFVGGGRCCWANEVLPEGKTREEGEPPRYWQTHPMTDQYFETLEAPLIHGREFAAADVDANPDVAILNAPLVLQLYSRTDVVGERLWISVGGDDAYFTVVGVVEGVRNWGLDQKVGPSVYLPYCAYGSWAGRLYVVMRSEAGVSMLAPSIREAVWAVDADLPVGEIVSIPHLVDRSLSGPRFLSILFGSFAGVGLLLACGGIYASTCYTVVQRRRELGIRMALGADPRSVIHLVLGQGLVISILGVGLGFLGALGLTLFLESIVWEVSTTDPMTFLAVAIISVSAAIAACLIPAREASRSDLLEPLRTE